MEKRPYSECAGYRETTSTLLEIKTVGFCVNTENDKPGTWPGLLFLQ
jgi:hypothetical protein